MLLDIVKQIVAKSGEQILFDSKKINAFFLDLAKDEPKLQKLAFIESLEHGVVKILKDVAKEERGDCKETLAQRLHTEEGLDVELYRQAIDILCEVLFGCVPDSAAKKYNNEPKIDYETCPHCRTAYANNNNPNTCPHCGKPLEFDCWNCWNKTKKTTCQSCGAAKDDETRFESIVKRIESLKTQKDIPFVDIETELNKLKNILPDYKKNAKSKLAKKIVEYEKLIYGVKFDATKGGTLRARVGHTTIYSGDPVAPGTEITFEAIPKFGRRVNFWDVNNRIKHENNRYYSHTSDLGPTNVSVSFKIISHYILLGMFVSGLGTAFLVTLLFHQLGLVLGTIIAIIVVITRVIVHNKKFFGMTICYIMGFLVFCAPGLVYPIKANIHLENGNYGLAIKDFNRYEFFYPVRSWRFYHGRGEAYRNKHDYDSAIADYTKAIQLIPDADYTKSITQKAQDYAREVASVYNNRGLAYHDKRDYNQAIADFTEAIRIKPDYVILYNNRGFAYYSKCDYNQAIADYTKAIQLKPDYATAYNNRGDAYYLKRDYFLAITDYRAALRIDPKNEYAKRRLEMTRKTDPKNAIW